ncbi:MAG: low molecular weight phosphotyrosine protein phosphatase [Oligoflexia bacterium]|nr:low molecular weight phosphotyrosine protein phosphatase [Oligoflexia bacterium]
MKSYHLAFVCTANICRSPMAEAWARHYGSERDWPIEVRSAGIMGLVGHPADPLAVKVMSEVDIDLSAHKSRGVDDEFMDWADHVLVMEMRHATILRQRFPESDGKVLMLGNFGGLVEVPDPIGGWRWRFRKSRDQLQRCVVNFIDQLPPPAHAGRSIT